MVHRDLLQVDKTASEDKILSGHNKKCGQDPDMDSHYRMYDHYDSEKGLKIERSIYKILQVLSINIFDKDPIYQLFRKTNLQNFQERDYNQLKMFDS